MQFHLTTLFLSALLIFAACSDDSSNPTKPSDSQVLMPLAVGNEWVYEHSRYTHGHLDTTVIELFHIYRTMTDSLGRTCYSPMERDTIINGFSYSMWWVNTARGLEYFGDPIGLFEFPYPAMAGYAYILDTKLMYYNMVVGATDTLITVPAGTFACYRYDYHNEDNVYFASDCYSPGIGKVCGYIVDFGGALVMKDELIEYHLN